MHHIHSLPSASPRKFDRLPLALLALTQISAQPVQNDALLSTIINDYVNSKFARGKGMAYVGMKLDHLERATLHLQIPHLPTVIARSRALHGMNTTDLSLPSSTDLAALNGLQIKGEKDSTLVFADSLETLAYSS